MACIVNSDRHSADHALCYFTGIKQIKRIISNDLNRKNIYGFFLLLITGLGVRQYRYMILGDILGRVTSLGFGMYTCRDIIFHKCGIDIKKFKEEVKKNFQVGIFLLVANLTGVLITGIPQFFIENKWGINAFGYISFSLNLSKMIMIVINSISIILVPFFRNSSEDKLRQIYPKINSILMVILFGILLVYYPLRGILIYWLPEYQLSIKYLALLFPVCLFERNSNAVKYIFESIAGREKDVYRKCGNCWNKLYDISNQHLYK